MTDLTVRQKIGQAFSTVGNAMVDDANNRLFNKIVQGPLDRMGEQELPALSIDTGNDKIEYEDHFQTRKRMIISLSYQWRRDMTGTIDNYDKFEYYLGLLIKAFTADTKLGGAIHVREAGTGSEIEGRNDPRPGGYLLMEVLYRHARNDPTKECPFL